MNMKRTPHVEKKVDNLFYLLKGLKENCDNGKFTNTGSREGFSCSAFIKRNGFTSTNYRTAMGNIGLLYIDDNNKVRWKANIPVTRKLCYAVVDEVSRINRRNNTAQRIVKPSKAKQVKPPMSSTKERKEIHTQKPITVTFDNRKTNGGNSTKTSGVDMRKKEYRDIPKVGVIRQFLRWIY